MKEILVPIDQAGRIVLPKGIRDELAIKPGDTFKISVQGTSVTLTPKSERNGFLRKGQALVFATAGDETLSNETVAGVLEASQVEREAATVANFPRRNRRE